MNPTNQDYTRTDGLTERTGGGLDHLAGTFGKYTILDKEERAPLGEERKTQERAKSANKVYKQVCADSGLDSCFFKNFATWSDYVEGRIDESEFTEKTRLEAEKMKASGDR